MKWFDEKLSYESVIISSRIRLARNLNKYPFSIRINDEQSKELTKEVKSSLINENAYSKDFTYIDFDDITDRDKLNYFESHAVSHNFLKNPKDKGLILRKDERASVMINEEDHIRLQTIFFGDKLDEAFDLANKIDDIMEKSLKYAFDSDMGYLTTCPTNLGTGLRASYMVHLPMLVYSGQLPAVINNLSKFGLTIRGVFGEGTSPVGHIFQISNQITIGRKEEEILKSLKGLTNQVIENEKMLSRQMIDINRIEWEDKVNRAYGILQNARKVSLNEGMALLSDIRFGVMNDLILDKDFKDNFYQIMMNTRSAHIQSFYDKKMLEEDRDIARANYLREVFA